MKTLAIFVLAVLLVAIVTPAYAMRCGSNLVTQGDTKTDVIMLCGNPGQIEKLEMYKVIHQYHSIGITGVGRRVDVVVPSTIELWTYNLGLHRLMRKLYFKDGRLKKIETLGYGY